MKTKQSNHPAHASTRYGRTEERLINGSWHETRHVTTVKPEDGEPVDEFKERVRRWAVLAVGDNQVSDCTISWSKQNGLVVAAEVVLVMPTPLLIKLPPVPMPSESSPPAPSAARN